MTEPIDFKYDYVLNRIKKAQSMADNLELGHIYKICKHEPIREYFTPETIAILYELFNGRMQYSYVYIKEIAQKYDNNTDPHLWKWVAIWLNILSVSQNIEAMTDISDTPLEYMIYYKKAADLGDIEAAYGLAYDLYYSDLFDYTPTAFEKMYQLLTPGVAAGHTDTIYLKTMIHCNEEEYDAAFPLFEILIEQRHTRGIREFIRNICNKHYRFIGEIKARTRDARLRLMLAQPPPEVSAFLAIKQIGICGDCTVCMETLPLLYHDCRQITHAVCAMCYCKTADKCPTCRFDFNAVKSILQG